MKLSQFPYLVWGKDDRVPIQDTRSIELSEMKSNARWGYFFVSFLWNKNVSICDKPHIFDFPPLRAVPLPQRKPTVIEPSSLETQTRGVR